MKLNLGCADRHLPGFIGVDLALPAANDTPDTYQQVDLAGPWPWPDSSVDEVVALDVCEHIETHVHLQVCGEKSISVYRPPVNGRIHFMNELHRVLKPGGIATIETPNAARGVGYFQDPTHVSPWCMSTFKYFEHGSFAHKRLANAYGITAAFRILEMREETSPAEGFGEQVWKIHAKLVAIK